MKRLAIIPARSGSKGLKDKNIIELCGKPMIAYSIIAAKDSGLFDKILVSTDSTYYAEIILPCSNLHLLYVQLIIYKKLQPNLRINMQFLISWYL